MDPPTPMAAPIPATGAVVALSIVITAHLLPLQSLWWVLWLLLLHVLCLFQVLCQKTNKQTKFLPREVHHAQKFRPVVAQASSVNSVAAPNSLTGPVVTLTPALSPVIAPTLIPIQWLIQACDETCDHSKPLNEPCCCSSSCDRSCSCSNPCYRPCGCSNPCDGSCSCSDFYDRTSSCSNPSGGPCRCHDPHSQPCGQFNPCNKLHGSTRESISASISKMKKSLWKSEHLAKRNL